MKKFVALALTGASLCVSGQAGAALDVTVIRFDGIAYGTYSDRPGAPQTGAFYGGIELVFDPTKPFAQFSVTTTGVDFAGPDGNPIGNFVSDGAFSTALPAGQPYFVAGITYLGHGSATALIGNDPFYFEFTKAVVSKGFVIDEFTGLPFFNIGTGSPTPEPSTWAMMIAGFGIAGASLRHRKRFSMLTADTGR